MKRESFVKLKKKYFHFFLYVYFYSRLLPIEDWHNGESMRFTKSN